MTSGRLSAVAALLVVGCHGRHVGLLEDDAAAGCDGVCAPVFDATCADEELPTFGGGCAPIGVAACGTGFDADGKGGCVPNLAECATPGQAAIPGAKCRTVTSCDTSVDRWGGLPSGPVYYVDAASTAASPDGSFEKPFARINDADDAITDSADEVIALMPGTYVADVALRHGQIWGACDAPSEIVGTTAKGAALRILGSQSARHVAVRGPGVGVDVLAAATLSGVWVHDTGGEGIRSTATQLIVEDSLVEGAFATGVHFSGAGGTTTFTMRRSVVRGTRIAPGVAESGKGIWIENANPDPSMVASIGASIVEDNFAVGIDAATARLQIDGSFVHRTKLDADSANFGYGVRVRGGSLDVTGSVFADNHYAGVTTNGALEVNLQNAVVRDTIPDPLIGFGYGIHLIGGHLDLVDSIVSGNYGGGVTLEGAQADVTSSLIMDTSPFGTAGSLGYGLRVGYDEAGHAGSLTMRNSSVVGSAGAGVIVAGSGAEIKDSAIRKTSLVTSSNLGNGLVISTQPGTVTAPSLATLTRTLVEHSAGAGIQIFGSSLSFNASVVRGCVGGPVLVAADHGSNPDFTVHDGSQCGCDGVLGECVTAPSSLGP